MNNKEYNKAIYKFLGFTENPFDHGATWGEKARTIKKGLVANEWHSINTIDGNMLIKAISHIKKTIPHHNIVATKDIKEDVLYLDEFVFSHGSAAIKIGVFKDGKWENISALEFYDHPKFKNSWEEMIYTCIGEMMIKIEEFNQEKVMSEVM